MNEVVGVTKVELDIPYDTKHHTTMVLQGDYDSGVVSAIRLPGWRELPSLPSKRNVVQAGLKRGQAKQMKMGIENILMMLIIYSCQSLAVNQ